MLSWALLERYGGVWMVIGGIVTLVLAYLTLAPLPGEPRSTIREILDNFFNVMIAFVFGVFLWPLLVIAYMWLVRPERNRALESHRQGADSGLIDRLDAELRRAGALLGCRWTDKEYRRAVKNMLVDGALSTDATIYAATNGTIGPSLKPGHYDKIRTWLLTSEGWVVDRRGAHVLLRFGEGDIHRVGAHLRVASSDGPEIASMDCIVHSQVDDAGAASIDQAERFVDESRSVMAKLGINSPSATSASVADPPAPPAGWYPDPGGRYELRYFDGQSWTVSVQRDGSGLNDPVDF